MEAQVKDSHPLPSIDLDLLRKLRDPEYRERFFLAEASAEIARQLIKLRKRRGFSQAELADRAGTQQPAVSRAEQADYNNWSFNTLRKLSNAMGGRLRVVIDAWEDVLPEYLPEDEEVIMEPQPSPPQEDAKPRPRTGGGLSAASGGKPSAGPQSREERDDYNFERDSPISRRRRPGGNDQGASQWSS
jgi:transcriptional regulator with XRE-family HTH domain